MSDQLLNWLNRMLNDADKKLDIVRDQYYVLLKHRNDLREKIK